MEPSVQVVEGRGCNGCTLCCKLVGISELKKPHFSWCPHCSANRGCNIYETRPGECRGFYCGYLLNPNLDEAWKPSKCKMVLLYDEASAPRLLIYVDPSRSGVWREEPFYSQLKRWAKAAASKRGQVIVRDGRKTIYVLPDRETEMIPAQ